MARLKMISHVNCCCLSLFVVVCFCFFHFLYSHVGFDPYRGTMPRLSCLKSKIKSLWDKREASPSTRVVVSHAQHLQTLRSPFYPIYLGSTMSGWLCSFSRGSQVPRELPEDRWAENEKIKCPSFALAPRGTSPHGSARYALASTECLLAVTLCLPGRQNVAQVTTLL